MMRGEGTVDNIYNRAEQALINMVLADPELTAKCEAMTDDEWERYVHSIAPAPHVKVRSKKPKGRPRKWKCST